MDVARTGFAAASGGGGTIALPGGIQLSKRAIAGIAAAAVALVLCSVGLSAAFTGEEPVARRAATMIEAPQSAAAAPVPVPARAAAPAPAEASSSEDEAQSPTVGVVGGRTKSGHRAKGGAKASFSATKVQSGGVSASGGANTFPKATDRCACKGDFNCILRCTATGK